MLLSADTDHMNVVDLNRLLFHVPLFAMKSRLKNFNY